MKKYLVIGNPIEHSLSPLLHNFWIKKHNLNAFYEKQLLEKKDIEKILSYMRASKIHGINVTVPFKQEVITYLDELTDQAQKTQSVNTIYLGTNGVIGHNTDVDGFESSLKDEYDPKNKNILISGVGKGLGLDMLYRCIDNGAFILFASSLARATPPTSGETIMTSFAIF